MLIVYTDAGGVDAGTITRCTFDLAYGDDENDFELTVDLEGAAQPKAGGLVYIEGTEYGGIIDRVNPSTVDGTLTLCGRTWHGILAGCILAPDSGQSHLTVSGDANDVLDSLIARMGLAPTFSAPESASGITIKAYSFSRYTDAYSGIRAMLAEAGAVLSIGWSGKSCVLSAVPVHDWSNGDDFDASAVQLDIIKVHTCINHLVCLGAGEGAARTVIDLYSDADGNISRTQTIFGLLHRADVYENVNAAADELEERGIERLKELQEGDSIQVRLNPAHEYAIGDIIGGTEQHTGISVSAPIAKKVVAIDRNGVSSIDYMAGSVFSRNQATPLMM